VLNDARMSALIALVLAVVVCFCGNPTTATAADSYDQRVRQCKFDWLDRGTWTAREEARTTRCVLERWPVPGGLPKFRAVIACESGWNRFAYNPVGPYLGLGQHDGSYLAPGVTVWDLRVILYQPFWWHLKPSWKNSRTQIVVTARMVQAQGWGPWACA